MIAIGDDHLELQSLEIASGIGVIREPVHDREQRVHPPQVTRDLRAGAGDIDDADRGGSDLPGSDDGSEARDVVVGDHRDAEVRLLDNGCVGRNLCSRVREGVEERGLAGVRQADDSDL